MQEYLMWHGFINSEGRDCLLTSKHVTETMMSHLLQPGGMREPQHHESKSVGPKVVQSGKKPREKPPDPMARANIPTNSEGAGTSRRISKVKIINFL